MKKRARLFKPGEQFLHDGIGYQVASIEAGGGMPTKIHTMQGTMFTFATKIQLTLTEFDEKTSTWIEKNGK